MLGVVGDMRICKQARGGYLSPLRTKLGALEKIKTREDGRRLNYGPSWQPPEPDNRLHWLALAAVSGNNIIYRVVVVA